MFYKDPINNANGKGHSGNNLVLSVLYIYVVRYIMLWLRSQNPHTRHDAYSLSRKPSVCVCICTQQFLLWRPSLIIWWIIDDQIDQQIRAPWLFVSIINARRRRHQHYIVALSANCLKLATGRDYQISEQGPASWIAAAYFADLLESAALWLLLMKAGNANWVDLIARACFVSLAVGVSSYFNKE